MLTKRANILFSDKVWQQLTSLAQQKQTSAGELIRSAVMDKYFSSDRNREITRAVQSILKHRRVFKGKIDYKDLINAGRKY